MQSLFSLQVSRRASNAIPILPAGFKMTKRIGKVEQFEFGPLSTGKHLHVTIAVSGFCSAEDDSMYFL